MNAFSNQTEPLARMTLWAKTCLSPNLMITSESPSGPSQQTIEQLSSFTHTFVIEEVTLSIQMSAATSLWTKDTWPTSSHRWA